MNREPVLNGRDSALEVAEESREAEGFALEARLGGFRCETPVALQVVRVEAPYEPMLPSDWDWFCNREEDLRWELEIAADLKDAWLAGAPLP